jgi:four helix bundle protein
VGANHRSACRARTRPDFISKISIAIEEADESLYWMEMLVEAGLLSKEKLEPLMNEADQLVRILTASAKTARSNLKSQSHPR